MATAAAAAVVAASEDQEPGTPQKPSNRNTGPPRIVVTKGFERLFSHYTGLHGEELLEYLKDFQAKALKVTSLILLLM
jgi:hypothetical protein